MYNNQNQNVKTSKVLELKKAFQLYVVVITHFKMVHHSSYLGRSYSTVNEMIPPCFFPVDLWPFGLVS